MQYWLNWYPCSLLYSIYSENNCTISSCSADFLKSLWSKFTNVLWLFTSYALMLPGVDSLKAVFNILNKSHWKLFYPFLKECLRKLTEVRSYTSTTWSEEHYCSRCWWVIRRIGKLHRFLRPYCCCRINKLKFEIGSVFSSSRKHTIFFPVSLRPLRLNA